MNCVQASTICKPSVILPNSSQWQRVACTTRRTSSLKLNATNNKLWAPQLQRQQQRTIVCVLGGKDKSEDEKPWEAFGKAMGNLKGKSIVEVLRQQMEKKEFYNGSGGKGPPWRRGGSGGGGDGSGGSENESLSGFMDETLQRIKATIVFILVYIYMVNYQELNRLVKDFIKYLSGGKKSVHLKNAMDMWVRFWERLSLKRV